MGGIPLIIRLVSGLARYTGAASNSPPKAVLVKNSWVPTVVNVSPVYRTVTAHWCAIRVSTGSARNRTAFILKC